VRLPALMLAAAFCLAAPIVEAAGFRMVRIPADAAGPSIQAAVWSPCGEPAGEAKLGSITLPATANCPIVGDKLPLVVISHGYGGNFLGHRDTAATLADAGFVVVAINHPIDSGRGDMSRADTLAVLVERPADIKRTIDFMLGAWGDHTRIDPGKVGFFGFSRGGYTGLVVAGGNPDIRKAVAFCPSPKPRCDELRRNALPEQAPVHDPRVKAVVIADPGFVPLFDAEGLRGVTIPLQLWASELSNEDMTGGELKSEWVAAIGRALPVKPDYRVVRGAGHFAFVSPCPAEAKAFRRGCMDRPGFDREAFHNAFNAAVVEFFGEHLGNAR
jgi:predicted dienelactone hydrolase